jgi:hypothetical protein
VADDEVADGELINDGDDVSDGDDGDGDAGDDIDDVATPPCDERRHDSTRSGSTSSAATHAVRCRKTRAFLAADVAESSTRALLTVTETPSSASCSAATAMDVAVESPSSSRPIVHCTRRCPRRLPRLRRGVAATPLSVRALGDVTIAKGPSDDVTIADGPSDDVTIPGARSEQARGDVLPLFEPRGVDVDSTPF